jgi:hypothetical protein
LQGIPYGERFEFTGSATNQRLKSGGSSYLRQSRAVSNGYREEIQNSALSGANFGVTRPKWRCFLRRLKIRFRFSLHMKSFRSTAPELARGRWGMSGAANGAELKQDVNSKNGL